MADAECVAFLQWALPRLDLRWQGFRKVHGQVCKRLKRRTKQLGLEGFDAYRERLAGDPDEWAVLDGMCHITVSRFYRDSRIKIRDITDGTSSTVAIGEVNWTLAGNGRLYGAIDPNIGVASGNGPRLMCNAQWGLNLPPPPVGVPGELNESYSSEHEGGAHFLFADGHVHFISENIQNIRLLWDAANPFDRAPSRDPFVSVFILSLQTRNPGPGRARRAAT